LRGNLTQLLSVFIKVEVGVKNNALALRQQLPDLAVELTIELKIFCMRIRRMGKAQLALVVSPHMYGAGLFVQNLCCGSLARAGIAEHEEKYLLHISAIVRRNGASANKKAPLRRGAFGGRQIISFCRMK
jgi:hypothetical protein